MSSVGCVGCRWVSLGVEPGRFNLNYTSSYTGMNSSLKDNVGVHFISLSDIAPARKNFSSGLV